MDLTPHILAAFVTPALATAGAAAMAAPILIHLLARRRFKRIRWAAMDFLIDAERKNRRRIQMEDWILMALRALAVLLVGLLVSRPFFSPKGFASWAGSQRTERVIVIDDSFSMSYEGFGDGTNSFARAKDAARSILRTVTAQTPDDTVTILRTSEPDKPIVAGAYLEQSRMEGTLARLEAISVSHRSMDLPMVFNGVVDALRRDTGLLSAAVYFVSDFQRLDWAPGSGEARSGPTSQGRGTAGLPDGLLRWAEDGKSIRTYLVNVGDANATNAAVVSLELPAGQVVAGTEGILRAELANFTNRPMNDVAVRVTVGNRPEIVKTIPNMPERQKLNVEIEGSFLRTGDEAVRVDLPNDALQLDDTRYLAASVVSALRILVVNGEPSPDSFDDETTLFVTALRPEGEIFSGFEPTVITESGLDEANLGQFHVVVLANVFRISDPVVESLERYVRSGGGLLIFLGDQVDADVFNSTFYRLGEGVSPAELIESVRPASPARLMITDRLHPALRGIGRAEDPLGLAQVPFWTYFAARPHGIESDSDVGGLMEAERTMAAGHVLARFNDPEERPAIIERAFGEGRAMLVVSSADKEWNLWADHPTYLPVMMELVAHLARSGASGDDLWVGSPIEINFDPSLYQPDVTVRPPGFPNEPEAFLTATPAEGGLGLVARWEHTDSTGIYQFLLAQLGGGEHIRLVAVNTDPRESDLAAADEAELRRSMGDLRFEYVRGIEALAAGTDERRTELWMVCLIAVVGLLMTEQALAFHWGRRR